MPGGKKHKYAMQWGMTITKPNSITDSIEKGCAQSWQLKELPCDPTCETGCTFNNETETWYQIEEKRVRAYIFQLKSMIFNISEGKGILC